MQNKTLFFVLCITCFCTTFVAFSGTAADFTNARTALQGVFDTSWSIEQNHRDNNPVTPPKFQRPRSVLLANLTTSKVDPNPDVSSQSANFAFASSTPVVYSTTTEFTPPPKLSSPNRPNRAINWASNWESSTLLHHFSPVTVPDISDGLPICFSGG